MNVQVSVSKQAESYTLLEYSILMSSLFQPICILTREYFTTT